MLKIPPPSWRAVPVLAVVPATGSTHTETWAVTDSAHSLSSIPADVRVIKLDDQQRIEEQLSKKLPPNPHYAALAVLPFKFPSERVPSVQIQFHACAAVK